MSHSDIVENTPIGITAARNLKIEREARRISRQHLSEDLQERGVDLSAHAIGRIERRQRRLSLQEAVTIASILQVNLPEFWSSSEKESQFDVHIGELWRVTYGKGVFEAIVDDRARFLLTNGVTLYTNDPRILGAYRVWPQSGELT